MGNEYCCEQFEYHLNRTCDRHPDPYDCVDSILIQSKKGDFGIPIHDGGNSFINIAFCPFCGSRFKNRATDDFRDIPRLNMSSRAKTENLALIWDEVSRIEKVSGPEFHEDPLDEEELLLLAWYLGWIRGVKDNLERDVYERSKGTLYGIKADDEPREAVQRIGDWHEGNRAEVSRYGSVKQVLVVRKDLNMRKGKMIAQAAHASMLSLLELREDQTPETGTLARTTSIHLDEASYLWLAGSYAKVVVGVDSEEELLGLLAHARQQNLRCALVRDEGRTEVAANTLTALAIGPNLSVEIDAVTGHLKLL